ncbi:MAG TPA: DUF1345 domain-containing protein [Coleofasciculaceae cyanobacterium]
MSPSKAKLPQKLSVRLRLLVSILVAGIVGVTLPSWFHWATRVLCIWDTGMICFLSWTWWLMLRATPQSMRSHARQQDEGRWVILSLLTAAACISIFAIGFLLSDKEAVNRLLFFHLGLSVITIVGSWLLVHTIFAQHYAHAYYQDHKTLSEDKAEGLDFPGEDEPDYWDFLYFSFVIGMTSQVSDVDITSRKMRQLSLIHGILSFFFNTAIVAMTINIIAGLIQAQK